VKSGQFTVSRAVKCPDFETTDLVGAVSDLVRAESDLVRADQDRVGAD